MEQMVLQQDNMSAQIQFEEDSKHKRSKHILMKITYVKDKVTEGAIRVQHIHTDELTPDILTK
ncbi:hypothetical protein B484DRAFT_355196, partial [Ochromonadaceae sp. CCMP2298]